MAGNHYKKKNAAAGTPIGPLWAGLLVFLTLALLCSFLTYQRYLLMKAEEQKNLLFVAESARNRLQQALQYSLSATQSMALLIDKNGAVRDFDSMAPLILRANRHIDAVQLVPGGVIRYVYPKQGNEEALNYDILRDSMTYREAYKAVNKQELFFAGPLQLKQGGIGVVGRLPVYINNSFWGFSAVVIRLRTLLHAAGIDTSGSSGYYFQLSKLHPKTGIEEFFLPTHGVPTQHFEIDVPVPNGEWILSVAPVHGYRAGQKILLLVVLSFFVSLLGGLFAAYYSTIPGRLKKLVSERTAALDQSEKRNKAIVEALPDTVLIVNNSGVVIDANNSEGKSNFAGTTPVINRKIPDLLPAELAGEVMARIAGLIDKGTPSDLQWNIDERSYNLRFIPYQGNAGLILIRDNTPEKKAEKELLASREELRRLSNYLEDVREEERLYIAREIHDELGQQLTVLKMNFSFLEKDIVETEPRYRHECDKITGLINEMMMTVRKISHELRPAMLDQLGLPAAMEWYAADFEKKTGIRAIFHSNIGEIEIPDKVRIGLFRIFQESLTNVARHANAGRVDISLSQHDDDLVLLIEDNGKGFDPATLQHSPTLGILGMKERAKTMDGSYSIHSTPGKGTITDVVVSLANHR